MSVQARLILLHKHRTSGRVRYLCLRTDGVTIPPLPLLSALRDPGYSPKLHIHPAAVIRAAELTLGLPEGGIELDAEFHAWVDTPEGDVPVLLGLLTGIDPPFDAIARCEGHLIALTDARLFRDIERELLRLTYEHVLG